MQSIGLIGVGSVGKLFLDSLQEAGYPVTVYDIDPSQVAYAEDRGAEAADSPAGLAEAVDIVILALPGTPEVQETMTGDGGMVDVLEEGQLVLDTTTTDAERSAANALLCEEWGVHWVSAPLTRAAPVEGLHMMVGGSDAAYEAAREVIETISDDHLRFEAVEDALRFKYMLQIRYASQLAIDAEIVAFARESDIDPRPLVDFLGMDISDALLDQDYRQAVEGLGGLAIWEKDVGYALEAARRDHIPMPITSMVHEAYKHGYDAASEEEGDAAAIARYWESLRDRQ